MVEFGKSYTFLRIYTLIIASRSLGLNQSVYLKKW